MNTETIQQMMDRYREGTLDEGGLAELNRRCQRNEVMAAAGERAAGIVRRRRSIAFTVAGLLVAGAAVWALLPQQSEAPLMAGTVVPEAVAIPEPAAMTVESQAAPAAPPAVPARPRQPKSRQPKAVAMQTLEVVKTSDTEAPVVTCNNQCEADSVISDIWKFLTA